MLMPLRLSVFEAVGVAKPDHNPYIIPVRGPDQPTILLIPVLQVDSNLNSTTRMVAGKQAYSDSKVHREYAHTHIH